jgi:hypothetical protein
VIVENIEGVPEAPNVGLDAPPAPTVIGTVPPIFNFVPPGNEDLNPPAPPPPPSDIPPPAPPATTK